MATATINLGGREFREYLWNGSWLYRTHSIATVRTVGYDDASTAQTAAQTAAAADVEARWGREGIFYWVEVETDTVGSWTPL